MSMTTSMGINSRGLSLPDFRSVSTLHVRAPTRGFLYMPSREPIVTTSSLPGDSGRGDVGANPLNGPIEGSQEVQDALAEVMMLSIRKEQVKEEILNDLEVKKNRLRSIGNELTEEFGREIELDKLRAELASKMPMADAMEKFQKLDDEVQALRDQLQADREDLADWEARSAAELNENIFLQRLKRSMGADAGAKPSSSSSREEASVQSQSRRGRPHGVRGVPSPVAREVEGPWRLFLFSYLALVPVLALAQDLASADPTYSLDALYGVIAVAMLYNVWGERGALQGSESGSQDAEDPKA